MNAASPGVVSAFQPTAITRANRLFEAIGEAMQVEYEAIVKAGFVLQLDCPDLAMARHTGFQDLTDDEFLKRAEHQVEALNHAVRDIPAEQCGCISAGEITKARTLTTSRSRRSCALCSGQTRRHRSSRRRIRGIATSGPSGGMPELPDDKVLIPACMTSTSNYVEHPELIAQRIAQFAGSLDANA